MANFNQFVVVGRLGGDAQVGQSATPVTRLNVATSVGYGEKQKTLWMKVTCFGKTAEFAAKLKKGDEILASGYLEPNEYKDKDGVERKETVMVASAIQAIGGKKESAVPF
jgi:single-strand DNA-binding protein